MIQRLVRAVVCAAAVCSAQAAFASPIEVGDWIHFTGSQGTLGGGAFTVHDVSDPTVDDFLTFCIQETQYIDYSSNFRVGSISNYADDASGPDYLDQETAWIMSNFSRGLLGSYSSNDIQWAIWKQEGEQSTDWGKSAMLIGLAHTAVLNGWTNDGVKVLNLFWADGTKAQDQVIFAPTPVPEPATMVLVGGGISALVAARRRRRAQTI
jgi:hypothetical protein